MPTESSAIVPPVSEPVSDASFYVSATEPTTRLRRTMKHDDCFLVFDSHGDVGASLGGPDGLFNCDTRYLSHFELLINGLQPLLLGSNLSDVLSDLTNPDIYYDRRVILQKDLLHVARTVEEAGREVAAQLATDVLIIEDEALNPLDLEALVENLGHKAIGIARTRTEAVTIARTKRPGLILADIQLADGSSGLDAVNDLLNTFEVPVIFITAYPERF